MSAARVALVRGSDLDVLWDKKAVAELFGRGRRCGWVDTSVEVLEPVCRASEATAGVSACGIDCAEVTGVVCGALPLGGLSSDSKELVKGKGVDRV